MKKILILMMLAFSVVMYASPPPVAEVITEQVQVVPAGEFQSIQAVDVQEVALVYLGNSELFCTREYILEPVAKLEFPVITMNDYRYAFADNFNKPPSNLNFLGAITKQHSNYGYPFTGN